MKTPTRSNNNFLFTRVASSQAGTIGPPPQRERVLTHKIKYWLLLSWDWEAWCLTVWGVIPPLKKHCLKQGAEMFSLPRGTK